MSIPDLTAQEVPAVHWVVVTTNTDPPHAYGAYNDSADEQAHKPFDEQTAKELAASINEFETTLGSATAMPLEETMQPGV